MKLLVTGASGFLGRRVVAHAVAAGHAVRAVVRPTTSVDHLQWPADVEVFRADLRGGVDLTPAFDGIDAVIHLAAGMEGTDEHRFQATVAGTERLLDAMAQSNTQRLLLASSFYVYDWGRIRRTLTEDSPIHGTADVCDGYTTSKVWQECVVRRMAERHQWELVVLRPGFIWGRGSELPPRVGMCVGRNLAVVGPRSDAALTHVDNCAEYFVRAAESRQLTGDTFNIFDGHQVSAWKFARQYQSHRSPKGWRIPVPYILLYATACIAKAVSRLVFGRKGRLPSLLMPTAVQARFRPLRFSTNKLLRTLGEPKRTFRECVTATFAATTNLTARPDVSIDNDADGTHDETADAVQETARPKLFVSTHPLTRARSVANER